MHHWPDCFNRLNQMPTFQMYSSSVKAFSRAMKSRASRAAAKIYYLSTLASLPSMKLSMPISHVVRPVTGRSHFLSSTLTRTDKKFATSRLQITATWFWTSWSTAKYTATNWTIHRERPTLGRRGLMAKRSMATTSFALTIWERLLEDM